MENQNIDQIQNQVQILNQIQQSEVKGGRSVIEHCWNIEIGGAGFYP